MGLRSTQSLPNTIVADATENPVLVWFASHDVADFATALADAAARDAEVSLVLETSDDPGGLLVIGQIIHLRPSGAPPTSTAGVSKPVGDTSPRPHVSTQSA